MIKLSSQNIGAIEGVVDENTVAEVHLTEEGVLITNRPVKDGDIKFPYAQECSGDSPCDVIITIKKQGDMPVVLGSFPVPAGYWLEGIRGYAKSE